MNIKTPLAIISLSLAFNVIADSPPQEKKLDRPAQNESLNLPPALKKAAKSGIEIKKGFTTNTDMMGWLAKVGGNDVIVYTPPSGDAVLIGVLLDADGKNLTAGHQQAHFVKPNLSKYLESALAAPYYIQGDPTSENIAYGFHEPNCGVCETAVKQFKDNPGDYQVRWIPVSFLKANSPAAAQAYLNSNNPEKDMEDFRRGALKLPSIITEKTQIELAKNLELMGNLGIQGTPGFFKVLPDKNIEVQAKPLTPDELQAFIGISSNKLAKN